MARNGAGVYERAVASYVAGTTIDQDTVNQEMDDIATALTGSVAKNGETTPTANLPMGTYRHTGVGNGSARTDYAAMGQVQDGKVNWVDGGGTADAITATYSPAITALVDGQLCHVRATAANATTTPTFSPNSLTARTIVKNGGVALVAGDIVGDGHELALRYDLTNTRWELLNPKADLSGVQPLDTQLTTLAGITAQQATDLAAVSTFMGTLLNDADAATARETLGVYKDIQPVGASVAANALTLTLNPTVLGFRSATLASGTTNTRTVSSAISVVVPDTATLGTVSGAPTRLIILAIDNAGTVELAVVNDATGNTLDETALISTTAITTGADSASVIYSTTARTNVPFRVVGFVDITEATAGTWATAPSLIQGIGGQVFVSTGSKSLAASGYQKLPSGLILQWGITASVANGSGRTATFPITFPNAAFVGFVIGTIGGGSAEANHVVTALSTTTLTFTNNSTTTQPFYYFSIGY